MKTSQLTRSLMLSALVFGLVGIAQADQIQAQRYRGQRLRIIPSVQRASHMITVQTVVTDGNGYQRLPTLKLSGRKRSAFARHRAGQYHYFLSVKQRGTTVYITVKKFKGFRLVASGSLAVPKKRTATPRVR